MSDLITRLQAQRPLVHCITNAVTPEWMARGLLAMGAGPIMADSPEEAGLIPADALLLNIGTWNAASHAAMLIAGQEANRRGIPVVLDPVGASLPFRRGKVLELLERVRVSAIRGNEGEIAALAGVEPGAGARGVDSLASNTLRARPAAEALARRYGCIVAVSGPTDLVTDGARTLLVHSGHPLLAKVTGTGCLVTAMIAAALATERSLEAVAATLLWMGAAAEHAAARADGPGSFFVGLLDEIAALEALPAGRVAPPLADRLAVYVIISGTTPLETVKAALAGGAGVIQWREKRMGLPEQLERGRQVRELCREADALFLVNDRVDLAQALQADGVHLGQDDLPIPAARAILGPGAIIGGTCETPEEARRAEAEGADYLGSGPVYATPSKADAGEPYGPAVIERVSGATALPVVGIGGIGPGKAAPVIRAGAVGVSVISAVTGAADPLAATRALVDEVTKAKEVK